MLKKKILNYYYKKFNKKACLFGEKSIIDKETKFEGNNYIGANSLFIKSEIGRGSYVGSDSKINGVKIGRFTSIGHNVSIISGQHPIEDFVSTHPAFYSVKNATGLSFVKENIYSEYKHVQGTEYNVCVGNDVWIGSFVKIMGGVTVGDGAVIGAGALVTHDVPPYAIVVGTPAKLLRYRFKEDKIKFLLDFKWWEKEDKWLKENIKYFTNIENLVNKFKI